MTDKQPVQADGKGGAVVAPDPTQAPKGGTGESAGGAQPGERNGRKGADDPGYHGPGQLGNEAVPGTSGGQGG